MPRPQPQHAGQHALPRRLRLDGAPAIVVGLLFAVLLAGFGDSTEPLGVALEVALCLAAGFSGRWPIGGGIAAGLLLSGMALVGPLEDSRFSTMILPLVLLTLASRGAWRATVLFAAWYLPVLGFIESAGMPGTTAFWTGVGAWTFIFGLATVAGWFLDRQSRAQRRLSRHHEQALRAQRRAIARDLHDTVAQAMTAMVIRAESRKIATDADPTAADDLEYIAVMGRQGLRDLQSMLAAMRSDEQEAPAPVALRQETFNEVLEAQTSALTRAGFTVRTLIQTPVDALPESIRYTLNCVVSEAATNILRHARPGSHCAIMVADSPSELEIVVSNEIGGKSPVPTNRLGLIGLTERVHTLNGSIETQLHESTWVLQVALPLSRPLAIRAPA